MRICDIASCRESLLRARIMARDIDRINDVHIDILLTFGYFFARDNEECSRWDFTMIKLMNGRGGGS